MKKSSNSFRLGLKFSSDTVVDVWALFRTTVNLTFGSNSRTSVKNLKASEVVLRVSSITTRFLLSDAY